MKTPIITISDFNNLSDNDKELVARGLLRYMIAKNENYLAYSIMCAGQKHNLRLYKSIIQDKFLDHCDLGSDCFPGRLNTIGLLLYNNYLYNNAISFYEQGRSINTQNMQSIAYHNLDATQMSLVDDAPQLADYKKVSNNDIIAIGEYKLPLFTEAHIRAVEHLKRTLAKELTNNGYTSLPQDIEINSTLATVNGFKIKQATIKAMETLGKGTQQQQPKQTEKNDRRTNDEQDDKTCYIGSHEAMDEYEHPGDIVTYVDKDGKTHEVFRYADGSERSVSESDQYIEYIDGERCSTGYVLSESNNDENTSKSYFKNKYSTQKVTPSTKPQSKTSPQMNLFDFDNDGRDN